MVDLIARVFAAVDRRVIEATCSGTRRQVDVPEVLRRHLSLR